MRSRDDGVLAPTRRQRVAPGRSERSPRTYLPAVARAGQPPLRSRDHRLGEVDQHSRRVGVRLHHQARERSRARPQVEEAVDSAASRVSSVVIQALLDVEQGIRLRYSSRKAEAWSGACQAAGGARLVVAPAVVSSTLIDRRPTP